MSKCRICGTILTVKNRASPNRGNICKSCLKQQRKKFNKSYCKYKSKYIKILKKIENIRLCPTNETVIQVRCKYCGKWFTPTNEQVSKRISAYNGNKGNHGEHLFYCSEACKHDCPIYGVQKHSRRYKIASSREVNTEFRKLVFERDNYTCRRCGKSKLTDPTLELHCHHIIPYAIDPLQDCDLDNGITLCKKCHITVHTTLPQCRYAELKC